MSSKMITEILYINNMTCVNCENMIERALDGKAGIEAVKASYSTHTVTITYDEDEIVLGEIEKIIQEHDYNVQRKRDIPQKHQKEIQPEKAVDYTNLICIGIIIITLYIILKRFGLLGVFKFFPIAKEGMGYGMLFLVGLLTSVHCVAMCGGICVSQCAPMEHKGNTRTSKFTTMRPSLLYNLGRVVSYTIIGGMVGAFGSVVSFSGFMKGIVQILVGIFMVIMGLNMLNVFPWLRKFNPRMPKIFAEKIYAKRLESNSSFFIGIINGLMPCGPLQAMQLYALSTGSPLKGAISMFLFSVGTFPLMFAFGALSSILNKKFTGNMMKASAVLVLVMGVFMFNSGASLSGLIIPSLPSGKSSTQTSHVAIIKDGVQTVTTNLSSGYYEPIIVQKGIPLKWVIQAKSDAINGCNNSIVIPKYNIQKDLEVGDNIIEFTPTNSETVSFSCWMGMIRSKITIVDNLKDEKGLDYENTIK